MGWSDTTPNLYLWGAIMGLEGTSFRDQRRLLTSLGYVVAFRFHLGRKVVKPLVSLLPIFLF